MAKKPRDVPEKRLNTTVILDQVCNGRTLQTWGWENTEDGRYCSGNPVVHKLENESSFMHSWRERD